MQKYNFQCRKALLSDDIQAIAKYLHLTDPYIYPGICHNPADEEWVRLISCCSKTEDNIFNIDNLSVVLHDDNIIGILCVVPCGRKLNFLSDTYNLSKEFIDMLKPVTDGYFDPLISESFSYSGFNITNVCVDCNYRNRGIGGIIMSDCIENYGHQILHLDVIAANKPAVNLYKRFGFEITNEYCGFSGDDTKLPCYHMIRTPSNEK